jgi:hypothetical protein
LAAKILDGRTAVGVKQIGQVKLLRLPGMVVECPYIVISLIVNKFFGLDDFVQIVKRYLVYRPCEPETAAHHDGRA